ncbi:MAG: DUF368 domain-containing protein [Phycisphaeraceae bacterium]
MMNDEPASQAADAATNPTPSHGDRDGKGGESGPGGGVPALPTPVLIVRGILGGGLMGLANLVPGISGATMLLAAGVYPHFITAVAEVTSLRFRRESMLTLVAVVPAAALAILLLARVLHELVINERWIMYSLFIGLTLGGVPVLWRMIRAAGGPNRIVWVGAAVGLVAMATLALAQALELTPAAGAEGVGPLAIFLAGLAGASAMILPGLSGGYLLLVLGVYESVLSGVEELRQALGARDVAELLRLTLTFVLPVGLGVVAGVVGVSHLLRGLLARHGLATLGALMGLLVGAIVGLWPFQRSIVPGDPKAPVEFFQPTMGQASAALALIAAGFVITAMVARLGSDRHTR